MAAVLDAVASERPRREYVTPMYSQRDVAQIVGAPTSTVHRWAEGYRDRGTWKPPLIELSNPGRGYTVPFIGLAQAFVLWSFRRAGVPMQRIRPAVEALEQGLGLEYALASNRLVTDGAEVLWQAEPGSADDRLIVVRSGQAVFNQVVGEYLRQIEFTGDYASSFGLPRFDRLKVTVDPLVNGGRPTIADKGIAVEDVLGRLRAGETTGSVAEDFDLDEGEVRSLLFQAA